MLKIFTSAALAVLMATAAYSMEDGVPSLVDAVDADERVAGVVVTEGGAEGFSDAMPSPLTHKHALEFIKEVLVCQTWAATKTYPTLEALDATTFPGKEDLEAQFLQAQTNLARSARDEIPVPCNAWTVFTELKENLCKDIGSVLMFVHAKEARLLDAFATALGIEAKKIYPLVAYVSAARGVDPRRRFSTMKAPAVQLLDSSSHYSIARICELVDKPLLDMSPEERIVYNAICAEYLSIVTHANKFNPKELMEKTGLYNPEIEAYFEELYKGM